MKRPTINPPPVYLDPETHRYIWLPTGAVMQTSVTTVCRLGKTYTGNPAAGVRGTHVHLCLEQFLTGAAQPDWKGYDEFIEPLLAHDYWERFEPWACELSLCDLKRSIGGQLDVLGFDHERQKVTLLDLKSKGSKGTYDVRPQLGAYCGMLQQTLKLFVEECRVMWAYPGEAFLGRQHSIDECAEAWDETYGLWQAQQKLKSLVTNADRSTPRKAPRTAALGSEADSSPDDAPLLWSCTDP